MGARSRLRREQSEESIRKCKNDGEYVLLGFMALRLNLHSGKGAFGNSHSAQFNY